MRRAWKNARTTRTSTSTTRSSTNIITNNCNNLVIAIASAAFGGQRCGVS
jgi:uncharacterized membrane protein